MIPIRHWTKRDLESFGIGIGIEPFKWRRIGHVHRGGNNHWFNIGPVFVQWSYPKTW